MKKRPLPTRAELLSVMRGSALFCALKPGVLELVALRGQLRGYEPGESVFEAGEPADRFFLVVRGRVKVFRISPRGAEQVLHVYGPGRTFGEAAMWAGGRFPACSQALDPAALFSLSRQALRAAFAANPDLAIGMMAGLSQKLLGFVQLIEDLSLREVPARLASALLDEARKAGGDRFRLRQTKAELAARIGTVPETLSRGLRKLRDADVIAVRGPEIRVLKPGELRRLAGAD